MKVLLFILWYLWIGMSTGGLAIIIGYDKWADDHSDSVPSKSRMMIASIILWPCMSYWFVYGFIVEVYKHFRKGNKHD